MSEQLYVLGHPIGHSKSPAMYNAAYGHLGLTWRYGFMDCATEAEARAFLAARDFLSINITTPYTPLGVAEADRLAPEAALAGGANLLVREGGALVARNVDGAGCVGYLQREGVAFADATVAVCGTGPTALAILEACLREGPVRVTLLGRDGERARSVLRRFEETDSSMSWGDAPDPAAAGADGRIAAGRRGPARACRRVAVAEALSYEEGRAALAEADLVIDATPLGMAAGDPAPFDTALIRAGQTVFDVVYGHGTTALVAAARAAGARALDGQGMLVAQAVASLRLVCAAAAVPVGASFDELFRIMAEAAGFDGLL